MSWGGDGLEEVNMLTLYHTPGSSSFAVHIALHEVGARFEERHVSIAKGDLRQDGYLAINQAGKVPTLLIDGRPLTEVAAILFYLAKRYPDARLLPPTDDVEAQAHVISWMSYIASGIHPIWSKGLDIALPAYEIADRRLGDRQWAVGEYSIADIHLFRLYWRLAGKFELPPGSLANLRRHHDQMLSRPAVQRALEAERAIGYDLP
jgi:glutathione S-transferase